MITDDETRPIINITKDFSMAKWLVFEFSVPKVTGSIPAKYLEPKCP